MGKLLKPNGDRIRLLREKMGWPQELLAEIADVSVWTVQRVEAGDNASFETLHSIADALGLETHELMGRRSDAVRSRGFRFLSADGFSLLFSWCQPYAPAARALTISFALMMLVASTISLSPLLLDVGEKITIVDSSQSITPPAEAGDKPVPAPAVRTPVFLPAAKSKVSLSSPPAAPAASAEVIDRKPVVVKPAQQIHAPAPAENANAAVAHHAIQTTGASNPLAGIIRTHWLRDLAQPRQAAVGNPASQEKSFAAEPGGRGFPGGYSVLGRPFVKSGKSTAAFFSKVGSSIKRAF